MGWLPRGMQDDGKNGKKTKTQSYMHVPRGRPVTVVKGYRKIVPPSHVPCSMTLQPRQGALLKTIGRKKKRKKQTLKEKKRLAMQRERRKLYIKCIFRIEEG